MKTYLVKFKDTGEELTVDGNGLMTHVETWFKKTAPSVHKYVYNKIVNARVPFENNLFIIIPSDMNDNPKRLKLPGRDVPKNELLEIADRRKVNYWTVLNTKNGNTTTFNNLAALARSFNVSYGYLYARVKYASNYQFGHYVFTLNTVVERLDSAERLRQLL